MSNTFGRASLIGMYWQIVPGMKEWNDDMSQTDIAQRIEADRLANIPEFMQKVTAQFQAANAK